MQLSLVVSLTCCIYERFGGSWVSVRWLSTG